MSDLAHPLWIEPWPLVLASGSATRGAMLRAVGIPTEIVPADIDERQVEAPLAAIHTSPIEIAIELAAAKAKAVSTAFPGRLVLGADQTLAAGSELFHKPAGIAGARSQLLKLRDREHALHSAAVLVIDGSVVERISDTATLEMRPFTEEFLDRYLASVGPAVTSSVGGYKLEAEGLHLFTRIQGDHFTVLGLPLLQLLTVLRRRGMILE